MSAYHNRVSIYLIVRVLLSRTLGNKLLTLFIPYPEIIQANIVHAIIIIVAAVVVVVIEKSTSNLLA